MVGQLQALIPKARQQLEQNENSNIKPDIIVNHAKRVERLLLLYVHVTWSQ